MLVEEETERALGSSYGKVFPASTGVVKQTISVLAYGCLTGVYDPCEIARLCGTDVAFRLLWSGPTPLPGELERARRRWRLVIESVVSGVMKAVACDVRGAVDANIHSFDDIATERLDIARHMSCQE